MNLEIRLNDWKRKLLDLGKRNGLINFKLESKSVFRLTKPSMTDIWNIIVENDSIIEFPCIFDKNLEDDDEEEKLSEYEYGNVFVNRPPREAQRILKKLKKIYKFISEEQGVNILYLTFGMLEWTESESSKQKLYSPLILVPVTLDNESIKSPLVLKAGEDEIVINPTLNYKLNHDFGVNLPDFNDENFSANILELENFATKNGWKFRSDVCLAVLSFLKINMYKDLERHKDSIMNNTIINAFAGNFNQDELGNLMSIAESIEGFEHDTQKPESIYQVVDADSSQQDAILCANKGLSFVLQGPPGTGKSQTITNIIASKLAEGKKVLFVSEKKAALEVVYKRLKECGLSDFILTLHSNKANKKETLSQLENVLALSRKEISLNDSVKYQLDKLVKDRDDLNAYAKQVNEIISPLNKSIFFANGIISKHADIEDISFSISDIRNTNEEKYRKYINILEQISYNIAKMNDDCSSNPWKNNTVSYMTNELIHDLGEKKNSISIANQEFEKCFDFLKNRLGITADKKNLLEIEQIFSLLKVSAMSPIIPQIWLTKDIVTKIEHNIETESVLQKDFLQLLDKTQTFIQELKNLNPAWNYSETDLYKAAAVQDLILNLNRIIDNDACFSSLKKDVGKLGFILNNEQSVLKFHDISQKILSEYNEDIFSIDIKPMEIRYKYNYNSFFKIFNSQYWKDQNLLKNLQINPKAKTTLSDKISLFENLKEYAKFKEILDNQQSEMTILFPMIYKIENTDFSLIHKELEKFDCLKNCIDQCNSLNQILIAPKAKNPNSKNYFPICITV